jgi:hypothetical protein
MHRYFMWKPNARENHIMIFLYVFKNYIQGSTNFQFSGSNWKVATTTQFSGSNQKDVGKITEKGGGGV